MTADKIANIVAVVVIAAIYLLPFIIASTRNLNSTAAIGIVNIFLGWTFVGWIVALVWALAEHDARLCRQEREAYARALRDGYSLAERTVQARVPCPHCAELVKREAKICRFCRNDIPALALNTI